MFDTGEVEDEGPRADTEAEQRRRSEVMSRTVPTYRSQDRDPQPEPDGPSRRRQTTGSRRDCLRPFE